MLSFAATLLLSGALSKVMDGLPSMAGISSGVGTSEENSEVSFCVAFSDMAASASSLSGCGGSMRRARRILESERNTRPSQPPRIVNMHDGDYPRDVCPCWRLLFHIANFRTDGAHLQFAQSWRRILETLSNGNIFVAMLTTRDLQRPATVRRVKSTKSDARDFTRAGLCCACFARLADYRLARRRIAQDDQRDTISILTGHKICARSVFGLVARGMVFRNG